MPNPIVRIIKCDTCEGTGETFEAIEIHYPHGVDSAIVNRIPCPTCAGRGKQVLRYKDENEIEGFIQTDSQDVETQTHGSRRWWQVWAWFRA